MRRLAILCLLAATLAAAEQPRNVPPAVAELLTRAASAEPAEVVRLVDGWSGEAQPLLLLARGQARLRLQQPVPAEADFRAALVADPSLRQAHLGLAQCAAAHDDWPAASRAAAAGIDPATADAAQLGFLAGSALHAGDWRLATIAAQTGILRFPDDAALRRSELAVLAHAGRGEDARQAALALLAQQPGDAALWRQLAWAAQQVGREDEALAALEAAVLLQPGDRALRLQLAHSQLARAQPQAALRTVRELLADPASADDALILLASRAAAEGGELAQARSWLAAVPEAQRSRAQRIQAARLAVQAGDAAAAGAALDVLVAAGERDASVLSWAASLAENADPARAEALYLRAAGGEGPATSAASLRLVALYLRQQRRDEAAVTLAAYLAKRPDDAQARALQAQLGRTPAR